MRFTVPRLVYMAKSEKRAKWSPRPKTTSTGGLKNPQLLTNACLSILEDQFGYSPLSFTPGEPRARAVTRYELVGGLQQVARARETYRVHPLPSNAAERYWGAVALDFQYADPGYDLISAQIVVFRGDPHAEKLPVFRAEWHCSPSDLKASHAQPHWHVYRSADAQVSSVFLEERPPEFPARAVPPPDTVNFHFAMSSLWQTNGTASHTHALGTLTALRNWLHGCLEYIRSELK